MNASANAIGNRLSLRAPQRESLEILAKVVDTIPLNKGSDPIAGLAQLKEQFPYLDDFERAFPSLCFALATGVGKTRLMGAFITYLFRVKGIRHFMVLAPNLTIYNKLIGDFTPNTPKYVFQGIGEFALTAPTIITGENYESGEGLRKEGLFGIDQTLHVNIFNISKINSEVRGGKAPRIQRLAEYIGEGYFDYLSQLDDLVLIMDEAHRYRASAGLKSINELKPILGLELTATPQVEKGNNSVPFKNVIYNYPLSAALADGFVKEPAVATRENFDKNAYTKEGLEKLKLQDGILIHEETKVQLEIYSRESGQRRVKPFILVVAEDTSHASALKTLIESSDFYQGQYKGKVIEVHSKSKGDEGDDVVQQLLSVEDPANPVEIVIHVNMLKEGWDVTNLYTIVPLRAANSKTLVEQSIGRGLRLPYGRRVGVPAVDRLTIVSHDNFQSILDEAKKSDSIIRKGVVIGRDIALGRSRMVTVEPELVRLITGVQDSLPFQDGAEIRPVPFSTPEHQKIALATLDVIQEGFGSFRKSKDLSQADIQEKLIQRVIEHLKPIQPELFVTTQAETVAAIVKKTIEMRQELTINIPRIIVVPKGEFKSGFADFDMDCKGIRLQPVSQEILLQHLHDLRQFRLRRGDAIIEEKRSEDYLVRGLIDYDDIDYDSHAQLLYKLANQVVVHLQGYLPNEADVLNVIQAHQPSLVHTIHAQMQKHYREMATEFDVQISPGLTILRPTNYSLPESEETRDFRLPIQEKLLIRGMMFGGFRRSLYSTVKFHSDTERRVAVILENDRTVLKWFKPSKGDFRIHYAHDDEYIPDFAVECTDSCFILEPKKKSEMDDPIVQAKAKAAALWCERATKHGGGKPWSYLLIPHDFVDDSKTLAGLAAGCTVLN